MGSGHLWPEHSGPIWMILFSLWFLISSFLLKKYPKKKKFICPFSFFLYLKYKTETLTKKEEHLLLPNAAIDVPLPDATAPAHLPLLCRQPSAQPPHPAHSFGGGFRLVPFWFYALKTTILFSIFFPPNWIRMEEIHNAVRNHLCCFVKFRRFHLHHWHWDAFVF